MTYVFYTETGMMNESHNGTFSNTDFIDRKLIGPVYLTSSIFFLILYYMTFYIILMDKAAWKFSYHKILISISVADIGQLIFSGIVSGIFNLQPSVSNPFGKVFGGISNSFWLVYSVNAHLLAINRCVTIIFGQSAGDWAFSDGKIKFYLVLSWIYGFLWMIVYMLPGFGITYSNEGFFWAYEDNVYSQIGEKVEVGINLFNLVGMSLCYAGIYVFLKMKVI